MEKILKLNRLLIYYKIKNAFKAQNLPVCILKLLILLYVGFVFFVIYQSAGTHSLNLNQARVARLFKNLNTILFVLIACKEFIPKYKFHQQLISVVYPNNAFTRLTIDVLNELASFNVISVVFILSILFALLSCFHTIYFITAVMTIVLSTVFYINLKLLIENKFKHIWVYRYVFGMIVTAYVCTQLGLYPESEGAYVLTVVGMIFICFCLLISIYNRRFTAASKAGKKKKWQSQLNYTLLYSPNVRKVQFNFFLLLLIKTALLVLLFQFRNVPELSGFYVVKYGYFFLIAPCMFFPVYANFFGNNRYLWLSAETVSGDIQKQKKIFISLSFFSITVEILISVFAILLFKSFDKFPYLILHSIIAFPLAFFFSTATPFRVYENKFQQDKELNFWHFTHVFLIFITAYFAGQPAFYYLSGAILVVLTGALFKIWNNYNVQKFKIFNNLFH